MSRCWRVVTVQLLHCPFWQQGPPLQVEAVDTATMAVDLRCLHLQEAVAGGMAGIAASLQVDGVVAVLATVAVMAGHLAVAHIQTV